MAPSFLTETAELIKDESHTRVDVAFYDEEYFERGLVSGVSGYMSYTWMPEMTLRMAHFLIQQLSIGPQQRVLDFGCAKGYLVKALHILEVDAYGIDVSKYALSQAPTDVHERCRLVTDCLDPRCFERDYDWMISKDVFEHIVEDDLVALLTNARQHVKRLFAVIPLGRDNHSGKYVIPEYDRDVTHVVAKTTSWWLDLFQRTGWTVDHFSHDFKGMKENWTRVWPQGNGFFIAS